MVLVTARNFRLSAVSNSPILPETGFRWSLILPRKISFPFVEHPLPFKLSNPLIVHARKRNSESEPVLKRNIVEEVSMDEEEDIYLDELEDDEIMDDDGEDYFEEEYVEDNNAEVYVGDGGEGGGISLAGTWWDKKALAIAEEVILSFDGELKIYAFKTVSNSTVQVRIEKLSNKSGSPSMEDIEAFSSTYRTRLDEAELAKSVPENISLEIPDELDRFKERPLYVKYTNDIATAGSFSESDGVFKLVSFDLEARCCSWSLADVRINREKAGKGRPLSKKQREWRLETPFDSLRLVRLYSDFDM
ncbi:uncharacterized protein LOC111011782 isoform X2 [Momordica charantia]|uniref:Uncharacterized protein LOC111011782 isoform X2 n=1 Tax=Momordica charantia TaxID=3673 RepID=A0A6J1CIZ0_MOMCH|nr:uncharacterized protein LOC111011782 isoform X2 [Momordica charantia]